MLKQEKEDLWKKEKIRRSSADKPWDVDEIGSQGETSKAGKGEEMSQLESTISVSKLEERNIFYLPSSVLSLIIIWARLAKTQIRL